MGLSLPSALGITNPGHFPTVIHLLGGPSGVHTVLTAASPVPLSVLGAFLGFQSFVHILFLPSTFLETVSYVA